MYLPRRSPKWDRALSNAASASYSNVRFRPAQSRTSSRYLCLLPLLLLLRYDEILS